MNIRKDWLRVLDQVAQTGPKGEWERVWASRGLAIEHVLNVATEWLPGCVEGYLLAADIPHEEHADFIIEAFTSWGPKSYVNMTAIGMEHASYLKSRLPGVKLTALVEFAIMVYFHADNPDKLIAGPE